MIQSYGYTLRSAINVMIKATLTLFSFKTTNQRMNGFSFLASFPFIFLPLLLRHANNILHDRRTKLLCD